MTNTFDFVKKLDVQKDKTVEYTIHELTDAPVLNVLPATEANKSYWNVHLKNLNKRKHFKKRTVTAGMVKDVRDEDRKMFPVHIIKGWNNMIDPTTEEEIPYTHEDCIEFVKALPDHIFDELREFCTDPANFVEYIDTEDIVKN